MSPSPHLLILASAGTGKTYRLSNRFLTLLLDGVSPERILATTFTRKAAGEILDRVLERLVEACESQAGCNDLAGALGRDGLTQVQCLELLVKTTRQLNAFQIRTIDSFFVHLAKLFALDLRLPPGWSIGDDRVDGRIRSGALQDLLESESQGDLMLLIRALKKGHVSRGVHNSLLSEISALRDVHLETASDAWDRLALGIELDAEQIGAYLADFGVVELPTKKNGDPMAQWVKAGEAFTKFFLAEDWNSILTKGLGSKFLAGDLTFYKREFPGDMVEIMAPLMQHACGRVLTQIHERNVAARDLLNKFEEVYQARKRSQASFGFSDLPHALAPRTAKSLPIDERELDLWFRLDARIDHLLLDEFQDTSPVQWRILEPIAQEISAEGDGSRSFFCVGDVKQSIYAFRQAEPRLLRNLQSMLPSLGDENVESMNKSWRSSSVVLDTVNRVFTDIADCPLFGADEHAPYRDACREFGTSFAPHEAARDLKGSAYMVETREPGEGEKSAVLLERVVERVALIREEAPGASIGILTRTRKPIPRIIYALRERGIDASGEGGNVLSDARAVLVFLSLLHLADFPGDSAAAFHVATSPFGKHIGLAPGANKADQHAKSRELREQLGREGLASFVASFHSNLADDSWSAWDRTRFTQLQDLAFSFEGSGEQRPSAFIDHVRNTKVEAPGGAAVRVMTIHGSKGLEFDAVLLPELSGGFASRPPKVFVDRPEPQDLIQGVTLAVTQKLLPISKQLVQMHANQQARTIGDDLCVLYVAMTRAARRLELIVPWLDPEKEFNKPSVDALLRLQLKAGAEPDENGILWSHEESAGAGEWIDNKAGTADAAPLAPATRPALGLAASTKPRSLPSRSPSSTEAGGKRSVKDALRSSRGSDIGTLAHALLESLEWSEDFDIDSVPAGPKFRRSKADARDQALDIVRGALKSKAIASALSRTGCGAPDEVELEVLSESEFALKQEAELWRGSIDRLVLGRKDGRVVWADVIDYKTDTVGEQGTAPLVERYRPQLAKYAEVVRELYGLEPNAVHQHLLFLGSGDVCALS